MTFKPDVFFKQRKISLAQLFIKHFSYFPMITKRMSWSIPNATLRMCNSIYSQCNYSLRGKIKHLIIWGDVVGFLALASKNVFYQTFHIWIYFSSLKIKPFFILHLNFNF